MVRLHKLSTLSVTEGDLGVILFEIVDTAIELTGADFGNIQLIDPPSTAPRIVAQRGFPQWWVDFWNNAPEGQGACRAALQRRERVIVEDVEQSPVFGGATREIQLRAGVRAVQSTPLISRSGKPIGLFATHYRTPQRPDEGKLRLLDLLARQAADIIEHVQVVRMLRESEERFRNTADGIPLMIWLSDANGGTRFINSAYMEFFGVTLEELQSGSWHSCLHPDDAGAYIAEITACLRDRRIFHAETRVKRRDGAWRWVESFGRPRFSPTGEFLGIAGASPDITERKMAEEALRSVSAELRQTLDVAATGLNHCSRDLRYLSANSAYAEYVGLPLEQIVGRRIVDVIGEAALEIIRPRIERVLCGETVEYEDELPMPGARKWVRVAYSPDRDSSGNVVGWVGSIMDITEHKRLEEERAEENRRKDEFLSLLGHELRNPLAAVSTAVQLLSRGVTDEQRAALNGMMDRQVKLMQRLLDDLLDLGRITHGYIQLKKEPIDLAKFLQHVIEVTQTMMAERGQEMIVGLPSEVVIFKADEARLGQIAINLLNNASKYTARGGRIEFSGAREGAEVVLRCRDNGRGIPLDMHQKIFEPFIRVEALTDSRGEASLGIGLALVKRMVELHGGVVTVESRGRGLGSEFVVRLPLESALSDQPASQAPRPEPETRRARSIVLVEDNPDVAGAMVVALEQAGYQVTLFADAFSALSGLSFEPHAVLLDIGLPGMDGYQLAEKLRAKRQLRHTLFIGLSGFKRRDAAESGDSFDHFFNKPVDLPALLTLLATTSQPKRGSAAS
jgi:PAS domain S-box-containing protein